MWHISQCVALLKRWISSNERDLMSKEALFLQIDKRRSSSMVSKVWKKYSPAFFPQKFFSKIIFPSVSTKIKLKETKTSPEKVVKDKQNTQQKLLEERIINYMIVKAAVTGVLEVEVKKMMAIGWIPYGGIGIDRAGMGGVAMGQMTYFQAMVKLEEE